MSHHSMRCRKNACLLPKFLSRQFLHSSTHRQAPTVPYAIPASLRLTHGPAGRSLQAAVPFASGDILLTDDPLIAVGPVRTADEPPYCEQCFRAIVGPVSRICAGCSALFCSPKCEGSCMASGHELICGPGAVPLEAWCSEFGRNFPRVAARILAKSLSASDGNGFSALWDSVGALASVSVPADEDALPGEWRTGYRLLCDCVRPRMGGNVDSFFELAFSLRAYARLMGTLRLNSFSLQCPLPSTSAVAVDEGRISGSNHPKIARVLPAPPAQLAEDTAASTPQPCSSSAVAPGQHSSSALDAGCCGEDNGCGSAGSLSADSAMPGRGTALYGTASLVNHSCEPNLDVIVGPEAQLSLRARRAIRQGEDLSIAYLDCALPVAARRARLQHGYGFTCDCALCVKELASGAS